MTAAPEPDLAAPMWPVEFQRIRQRLARDFPAIQTAVIDHCLAAEVRRFEDSRITTFVPVLVDKNVRAWLRDMDPT
jgi:hypothetical protein